jgi:hypothetical protein
MDAARIENALDKVAAGATEIDMSLGGIKFRSMIEVMEFSKLMALSQLAVPIHLRNNPGACLAICTKALRNGFDPFSLAEHSFCMVKNVKDGNDWVKIETIAYDSFVIRGIINAHAPIKEPITFRFEGEGDARICIATAKPITGEVIEWRSSTIGEKLAKMERNDKGKIKGSPLWESPKQDVQFAYDTGRDLCRVHFPETLMGWHDKDDFEPSQNGPDKAKDVTPKSGLAERLKGNKGKGFNAANIEKEITDSTTVSAVVEKTGAAVSLQVGAAPVETIDAETGELVEYGPADAYKQGGDDKTAGKDFLVPENLIASASLTDAYTAGFNAEAGQ